MQRLVSGGLVLCLALLSWPSQAALEDPPAVAARITLGAQGADGLRSIVGAAGAVAPSATVICVNLDTGHYAAVAASNDGSFTIPGLYAPAGSSILVKVDRYGRPFGPMATHVLVGSAGTILRVPDPAADDGAIWFGGASLMPGSSLPAWRLEGTLDYEPGQSITIRGTVIVDSPVVDGAGAMKVRPRLALERLSYEDGSPAMAQATFASTLLTPTGFPIERTPNSYTLVDAPMITLLKTAPGRAEAQVDLTLPLPPFAGAGMYRPVFLASFDGVPSENPPSLPVVFDLKAIDRATRKAGKPISAAAVYAPVIRVGDPDHPRMNWMLLANHAHEGTRGAVAVEDRERFGFAPRVASEANVLIVPRLDAGGKPLRYRLEPFAPGISLGDRELPSPPSVPLRLPSGSLTAEITRPDGTKTTLGPLPFAQTRSINAVSPGGAPLESGGGYPHDPLQLSTMDDRFEVTFDGDGEYRVRLDGWIEDAWGNRWNGSGTYEVIVARPMLLDTAVLPGTPFEEGDTFHAAMQVVPPVPADVELRVDLLADSDPAQARRFTGQGQANRFGRFRVDGPALDRRGEYRADALATWRDSEGNLWAGARSWGGVVAPRDATLVAHGRRGIDDQQERPAWFHRSTPTGSGHIQFPFLGGDVLWAIDLDAAIAHVTWADPQGAMQGLVSHPMLARQSGRYAEGDTPPLLLTSSGADPHLDPAAIDCWCYAYRSVQRPLVRVREIVGEESGLAGYYWRFGSQYGGQSGVGQNGDLPNDFKFQFGGVVIRGAAVAAPQYAVYGSLFVLVPGQEVASSRVFPPFRGNGGGPDGGPLFALGGKDVDLFLHPTGVRPGTILHRGERISFAGYSAPTLPSKVEVTVTSPSGTMRTVRGQANAVGWFHDPSQDFDAFESGVWKAKVRILFDGRTSAGQVSEPFPSGGVLGSREGEFYFYVVDANAPQLEIGGVSAKSSPVAHASRPVHQLVRPADGPVTITVARPAGLTGVRLAYTTTMPGFVLEEGTKSSLSYTYDAEKLEETFPNLDLHDMDGRAGADVITISLFLSGEDSSGATRHFARQVVIRGEELLLPDQRPSPRRRAVR